jgi:hypothetical protein
MDNRSITFMIVAVIIAISVLLAVNVITMVKTPRIENNLQAESIQRVAIFQNKKPIELNADQLNILLPLLKQAKPLQDKAEVEKGTPANFEKLVIYRENDTSIVITPSVYIGTDLVFSTPEWNKGEMLQDTSHGILKALILQTINKDPEPVNEKEPKT